MGALTALIIARRSGHLDPKDMEDVKYTIMED